MVIALDSRLHPTWVWQSTALATTILLAANACSPTRPRAPKPAPPVATETPPTPVWHRFGELRTWPALNDGFRTEHLTTPRHAITHASPEAADPYRQLVAGVLLPPGSALVQSLAPDAESPPSEYLVMERAEAGWGYLALDAEGRPTPIAESLCRRCHEEALSDELFGPRRAPPTSGSSE